MNNWQEIQTAFLEILSTSNERRAEILQGIAARNPALADVVSRMLAAHEDDSGFLEDGSAARTSLLTSASIPEKIGHYKIIRELGHGGMGTVYEAEQEHPRRRVALKVINGTRVSPELIRRFHQESEALARLAHPGIAQIYEAGTAETDTGLQPFFAMEFIRGEPLIQYVAQHRLNTRERLELIAKVCAGVEHAHERGLIHRDLKPGNILVNEAGQPKILDFGVARITDGDVDATQHTKAGQLVGTLAYMSPEQTLADTLNVDTRSDVYALGVLLYQLLAGRLPYRISAQMHEAVRAIQDEDPAPLSSVNRSYRGDIETIVAKALEKDKARRYASAAALASDLHHYLADEPITARPPSTTYQLQKFARRHKALVAGVVAVFVVLAAGIVVSTNQALRARRAEHAALNEAATAKAVNDFLQDDLLAQASSSHQSLRSDHPDPNLKVRTALDRAAARVKDKFHRQPEVEAAIRETIGETYLDLGLYPEARTHLERALALNRDLFGPENANTLKVMRRLGSVAELAGKYAEAEALLKPTLDIQQRLFPPEHPDTLECINYLAITYYMEGKYQEAAALYKQSLDIKRRILGVADPDTLVSITNLANLYLRQGNYHEAEALVDESLQTKRRVLGPKNPGTLNAMNSLAVLYWDQGKYAQAEALHKQTLDIKRRVLGPEHPETLASMNNLGSTYYAEGKYLDAAAIFNQTLAIKRRILGPQHPDTLAAMSNLADATYQGGKYAEAEQLFLDAVNTSRRLLGPENQYSLSFLCDFAGMYQREGNYTKAEDIAAQCLAGQRHAGGSDSPATMDAAADLALAYVFAKKFTMSEPLARDAVEFGRRERPDEWQRYRAETLLGESFAGQRKYAEAEPLLLEGYRGMESRKQQIAVPDRYHLVRAYDWITQLYLDSNQPDKAAGWKKMHTAP